MSDRTNWMNAAARGLMMLASLALVLTTWFGAAASVMAQGNGRVDVAIFTDENGRPAYDACYVLVGYSNEGCDENRDGRVMFSDIPYGVYTVHQTADLGPGRFVSDFTIRVRGNINSAGFEGFAATIVSAGGPPSTSSGQTSNVAIVTLENGRSATDVCYVLVDFSNVGCDENRDGAVTFRDVPLGVYTLRQTADLGPGRAVADRTITVTGNMSQGWERFTVVITAGTSSPSGAIDIALITRDPEDGHLLTGACYVLVGYSNVGCDENGDGQVTFAAIPYGMYTVRQTQTPAGYPTINDYEINVQPFQGLSRDYAVPLGFIVKQAPRQNAPHTRNVSVVFVDSRTFTKVVSDICVQFVGASNVGCDEDLRDGQIDFLDVPAGTYEIRFNNIPRGWQIMGQDRVSPTVTIDAGPGALANQVIYVGVYVP